MAEAFRNQDGLKEFIVTLRKAYADNQVVELDRRGGGKRGIFKTGLWRAEDNYNANPEKTVFNGRTVVSCRGQGDVWAVNYDAQVIRGMLGRDRALDFYNKQVMASADPRFPVCGEMNLETDGLIYKYESLKKGALSIGRFAVREAIWQKSGGLEYQSHLTGGWLT